jgi:AraC-like DNA-binding protein
VASVLNPNATLATTAARPAAPALAPFVERCWTTRWDLREPYVTEILSDPSQHLAVEAGRSRIVGVHRTKFTRRLEGAGRIVAAQFRPGGFRPWAGCAMARFTDRQVPLERALDCDVAGLEREVLGPDDDGESVARLERFLRERLPPVDPDAVRVGHIVARIAAAPEITRVEALVDELGLGARVLQRLFKEYVGLGPKWVIRRFRLQEAAEAIKRGQRLNLAALAVALGYYDQAHFSKDFKATVGVAPADFRRSLRPSH